MEKEKHPNNNGQVCNAPLLCSYLSIYSFLELQAEGLPSLSGVQKRPTRFRTSTPKSLLHLVIDGDIEEACGVRIYLSQNGGKPPIMIKDCDCFSTEETIFYEPFCDDFGPMNFSSVVSFVRLLEQEIRACAAKSTHLVYVAQRGPRNLTNCAFLLGAYLILKCAQSPEAVEARFDALDPALLEEYRDATYSATDFRLRLIDCWRGLARAQHLGWIAAPSTDAPNLWGMVDEDQYARLDNPLNGDVHMVVPERFAAFKGPRDIEGRSYVDTFRDGRFFCREFAPAHYVGIFHSLGVSTVVRLNDACYQRQAFVEGGIDHHDLFFDDCTPPPPSTVQRYFAIVDAAAGAVAIHCKAGLGRTGTLIALSLIRSHGFSAREAIGWLRIMRPGSVLGRQQQFLCDFEAALVDAARATTTALPAPDKCESPPTGEHGTPSVGGGGRVRFALLTKQCTKDDLRVRKASALCADIAAAAAARPESPGKASALARAKSFADLAPARSFLAQQSTASSMADLAGGRGWEAGPAGEKMSPRPPKSLLRRSRLSTCSTSALDGEDFGGEATAAELAEQVSAAMLRRGTLRAERLRAL